MYTNSDSKPRNKSVHKKIRSSPPHATSKILSTGQRIHVMNASEFDDLRRKLRMQTASRRYRKRKKVSFKSDSVIEANIEEARQQRAQILELQAELTRLKEIEAQTKQYQQRSIESLEKELKMHNDEVTDLSKKIQDAAKEEQECLQFAS
ncbi:hypothetical protein CCR75_004079 [Bremia lactucae]|uniref:Uncharacterized protein n=1 Tax=Bremia lactucae TaxID=4779 RepID=A0A976IKP0_BRELC|nr:hypothetical protein CCR75_004079 [Bremia lactucae]